MIKSDVQLDAKGLACPMPIVKTKKKVNELLEGQVLEIQATDKGSKADLAAWAASSGHQYIGTFEEGEVLFHYIRKCNKDNQEQQYEAVVSNEEVIEKSRNGGLILDVREEAEFAFGHIDGAKSIPLGELEDRMNELNREQPIYVICRTGTRSDLAAQKLANAGFSNVFNVVPGMSSWNGELTRTVQS